MIVYFILILYVLLLPLVITLFTNDTSKQQKLIAFFSMLGIFLLLSLKAPSVGIDIKGYREQYYISRYMSWNDYDYVYFEKGYMFLEKLFSKIGFSFQIFTVFVYAFECFAWYKIISKYSSDAMISVMFFICYQFFVFSVSGLRQCISMSICIFAFILVVKWKPLPVVFGALLILAATYVHSSSFVFFSIFLIIPISKKIHIISGMEIVASVVLMLVIRQSVWSFVNNNFRNVEVNASVQFGGNFMFLVGIFILSLYTYNLYYGAGIFSKHRQYQIKKTDVLLADILEVRIALMSVCGFLLLSGGKMLRALSYFTMLLVPMLPNVFNKYRREQRFIFKIFFVAFLLYLFYSDTLSVNQLEISHYKFFWQE